MEQNVGLVVLEHLSHKLYVQVLNVDFLVLYELDDSYTELNLIPEGSYS